MSFTMTTSAGTDRFRVGQLVELNQRVYRIKSIENNCLTLQEARLWDRVRSWLRGRIGLRWFMFKIRFWDWWYRDEDDQGEPGEP